MKDQTSPATDPSGVRQNHFRKWAPLPLRLIVGYGFMSHGYAKLARGPEHFAAILKSLGVPSPELAAWATVAVELLGGLAMLIGAFVALISMPMIIVMLTAIFTVHWRYGFSSIKLLAATPSGAQFGPVGYEINLLYIAAIVVLVMGGAGPLSVDGWRCKRKPNE
ncbi:MAG TPA: DoxX family protein [Candidatus Acidoferrales bacterium]|jgi:putative oxidoreductase|nr:DoxX family protein [Candidatus Acidoferrales bacterium]